MELRHLRYFVAVAEELHFGHAAQRLQIAQPPLSQQIRQLEQELGVELLYRTKRTVRLTEAGQAFLQQARQILVQSEQAIEVAQRASRGEVGRLAIGFVGSATCSLLPDVVRSFRRQFPDVRLLLHEMTTSEQLEALHDDRIQIGFLCPPINDAELSVETVLQESFVAVLPEVHPLATQTQLSLASLAEESFILSPRHLGSGFHDQIIRLCQQVGFMPQVTQEAIQMQTILSLVAAELGVALVPASLQTLQRAGVVYKPLEGQTLDVELAMVWRSANSSPVLHQFLAQSRAVT
ncbi:LysR family transcriptional regulator [Leptolyngbya sp. NIES-2104]|uniref:LysR family transcriptional regulator n=1 Tax=Leptolyngbya sp. NIES-2104 TaxID=1552121 RepID=UPI00073EF922|nr:LysR family transcriptional regulator [Leptolyngbya sp. NIES-2104]